LILPDVNVLVYAHRSDAERHADYRLWLESVVAADQPFGIADLVLSGFLRIVTHPRVFKRPTPLSQASAFCAVLRSRPNASLLAPGPRHWQIFTRLCEETGARGNLVPDAYLAALAIETGSEWITTDRDYSRFPGLRLRHPLAA
jgi:toxin-antitoxin system PIN domain toxin